MVFKLRPQTVGQHTHVTVFSGEDVDHLRRNGELVFALREWGAFLRSFEKGTDYTGDLLMIDSEGAS